MNTAPATTTRPTRWAGANLSDLVRLAGSDDYQRWQGHIRAAAGCAHPIRLRGDLHTVETSTGRIVDTTGTDTMPDGVLYVPCGNRRATVCPSCAETYRADTFQLVKAGLAGGKGVPPSVAEHPCVFLTGTAPSFGPHTHHRDGRPCRPRRDAETCPHGVLLECRQRHAEDDPAAGRPLCLDCYDHDHQIVWNGYAGELWRRSMNTSNRLLRRLGDRHGVRLRLSYAKVAEFQRRGVAHIHAMVRLDGIDPVNPDAVIAPPASISAAHLALLLRDALTATAFTTEPHPRRPDGWPIAWGAELDPRQVRLTVRDIDDHARSPPAPWPATWPSTPPRPPGMLLRGSPTRPSASTPTPPPTPAGSSERPGGSGTHPPTSSPTTAAGHASTAPTPTVIPSPSGWPATAGSAPGPTCSASAATSPPSPGATPPPSAHSARHGATGATPTSTTPAPTSTTTRPSDETTVVIASLAFAGIGWHTTVDALLANTAAANAREQRLTAREELATTPLN